MRVSVSSKYLQPALSINSGHLQDGRNDVMVMHVYDEHIDNLDCRKHAHNDIDGSAQNRNQISTNDKRNDSMAALDIREPSRRGRDGGTRGSGSRRIKSKNSSK